MTQFERLARVLAEAKVDFIVSGGWGVDVLAALVAWLEETRKMDPQKSGGST